MEQKLLDANKVKINFFKKIGLPKCDGFDCVTCSVTNCTSPYPEFTEDKEYKILKFLSKYPLTLHKDNELFSILITCNETFYNASSDVSFNDALVKLIQNLWNELDQDEQDKIKQILIGG